MGLGSAVRELREAARLPSGMVAERSGLAAAIYSKIELERQPVNIGQFAAIVGSIELLHRETIADYEAAKRRIEAAVGQGSCECGSEAA